MNKNLPALGTSVVLLLDNGSQQSATFAYLSRSRAHFTWKTGPGRRDFYTHSIPSAQWNMWVLAVFPKDVMFLAV